MSSFDSVSQSKLVRFLEHRIADPRIIRLIQKWLKAGVLEDGVISVSGRGTGQGSVISPLLANIYLHYALDLWAMRWQQRLEHFTIRLTISGAGEVCRTLTWGELREARAYDRPQALD